MLFRKKEEPHKGDVLLAKGIYLKKPAMNNGSIIMNCFWRCVIVFLLVFGTVGGFLSAFHISYHILLVIVFYILLSMYFSFLYSTSKMLYRDLGYILFFSVFIMTIYQLRLYANSGFYAIVNTVLRQAQTFFDLSGVREYDTPIQNDYMTIAVVCIFIGMIMIIILNIWIYSTMSLFWTGLLTFPILLIPIYMKLVPDPLYIIALGIGYVAVVVFKANGHYLAFAWDTPFRVRGFKKDRITYTQDAGIFRQVLLTLLTFVFVLVILVEAVFPDNVFEGTFKNDRLREQTSEVIGNFVLLGFAGLFNQYPSTGGISGGKLGGISNVRPDYLTDLIVSYTPYSNDAVYLKGYTGGLYGENEWESLYNSEDGENAEDNAVFEEESLRREALSLKAKMDGGDPHSAVGKMDIYNVGADPSYLYYPYYTLFRDYTIYNNHSLMPTAQGLRREDEANYQYYPQVEWGDQLGNVTPSQIDTTLVDSRFLDVPEKNLTVIEQECERIGLREDMTENEIVDTVRAYFAEHIPYTLKPGATPRKQDFINYFLTKNRKGYCAHFASAATLIFRQMGIPARYVEGYAFSLEAALDSDMNSVKQYADYYKGYSALGKSAVLDVEVSDAMAHAWVEIYVQNFGWKVVEVTPGSNEMADEDDFWSAFSDILGGGSDNEDGNNGIGNLGFSQYVWLVYVVGAVILFFMLLFLVRLAIRKGKRFLACHQENRQEAVIACYADICDMMRVCYTEFDECRSHMEQLRFMQEQFDLILDREVICRWIEQISFSLEQLPDEALDTLYTCTKQVRKGIWNAANWRKKVALWKR